MQSPFVHVEVRQIQQREFLAAKSASEKSHDDCVVAAAHFAALGLLDEPKHVVIIQRLPCVVFDFGLTDGTQNGLPVLVCNPAVSKKPSE